MSPPIDYSAYKVYQFCPLKWWEHYGCGIQRQPPQGQRDDVLTLGSLVHKGLERLRTAGAVPPWITVGDIEAASASPECAAFANLLITGYADTYPAEDFTDYKVEQPLRFPLGMVGAEGLAKLDAWFEVRDHTTIESGLGDTLTLEPGIWVHEYKTKDASRNLGNWVAGWQMNMQPCFQILALQHHLQRPVQGVLINCIEKPPEYKPKHSCKGCKVQSLRADWQPTGEGFACPQCGNVQDLDLSDKRKNKEARPAYYRLMVTKTKAELALAQQEIERVWVDMEMIRSGVALPLRATERCVDGIYGPCTYLDAHKALQSAEGWQGFVKVEDVFSYLKQ